MSPSSLQPRDPVLGSVRLVTTGLLIFGLVLPSLLRAHEGHAPLPTKGATVEGSHRVLLSARARQAIGVESVKVTLGDRERVIHARARIQLPWHQQAMITTLVPGRVEAVLVRPGDVVKAGQELARIQSSELETLQRDLLRAVAERSLAERLLTQRESLGQSEVIATVNVLEARRDADEARSKVEVATRKLLAMGVSEHDLGRLRSSGEPLRSLPITSPLAGVVVHADVRAGQIVATDEHLFHVIDPSEVEVVGEVLESDAPAIRIGQPVEARLAALPGTIARGRINHTHLSIEPATRTLAVVAHVENRDQTLKPGMTGIMTVQVALAKQAIVCPAAALLGDSATRFVLLDRGNGRYERRVARFGIRSGDRVEVLDGLFPGDRVVIVGTNLLASLLPPLTSKGAATAGLRPGSLEQAHSPSSAGEPTNRAGRWVAALGEVELPIERKQYASAPVEGRIARILVHPGDEVRGGQVLAEVESLPLRTLQLELLQARTRLKWTADSVTRLRSLAERQATSRIALWREEAAEAVLHQTIGEIRARLLTLGLDRETLARLERADLVGGDSGRLLAAGVPIRAPAAGRLEHFEVVPGQVVAPSASSRGPRPVRPLFEIHDRSHVWICAHVRDRDAAAVRIGQAAQLSFPALPGFEVAGQVVRISPVLEDAARALPIWVEVANRDGWLYEGMLARAAVAVDADVPSDAKSATRPDAQEAR